MSHIRLAIPAKTAQGPPTMFDTDSGAYKAWQRYGKAVLAAKPKGLIVVSAHWENPRDTSDVIGK
jgi:4,5-DOPA dioxygenase extradiol